MPSTVRKVGGEQAYLLDGAGHRADLDILADTERPQHQQHDAGSDVLQRALQRQADGEADGADGGDDRRRLDAELAEHHDDHQARMA